LVTVSRAGFLKVCGALLLGRTVGADWTALAEAFAADAPRPFWSRFRLEHARAAHFRPHVHTIFTVESSAGMRLPLVLARVTERPVALGVEQFSLVFHAPPDAPPVNGTNTFHHRTLGEFALFITLVGASSAQRAVYEACFSRLPNADERRVGDHCHA
jgi:hypothetical protein